MTNNLKIIKSTSDELRVGNHIVLFGGKDLDGEHFTADTDLASQYTKAVGRLPVDWEHGQAPDGEPQRNDVLGYVDWSTAKKDSRGVFVERVLDRQAEYMQYIEELINDGVIATSSEAIGGQVEKTEDGQITQWPLKRDALTVTPAEPRMLSSNSLGALKSLSKFFPHLKSLIPTSDEDGALNPIMEIDDMTEQTKNPESITVLDAKVPGQPLIDLDDFIAKALKEHQAKQDAKEIVNDVGVGSRRAPAHNKTSPGDTHAKAYEHWIRYGDEGALKGAAKSFIKASNATDMNVGTDADGGHAVPQGHYNEIIARRDESALADLVDVRNIEGYGTTTHVPVDAEADGEFVSTAEAAAFDLDAPAIGNVALTQIAYSKEVRISNQLLQDEGSNVLEFVSDFIGRGVAKTENNLLLTEVAANGSNITSFAATGAIVAGEPEDVVSNGDMAAYLDDGPSTAFVMRAPTFWHISSIVGNPRLYNQEASGGRQILDYPVHLSNKAAAMATGVKSVYFGNWNYVARYGAPGLTVLRDPFSNAGTGQVSFWYYFRVDYGVLQSEAIGYADQA